MALAFHAKSKKSPWIPPPGRSRHSDKVTGKSPCVSTAIKVMSEKTAKLIEEIDENMFDKSEISEVGSHVSSSASDGRPCIIDVNLSSIKEEMKLFSSHFTSLKQLSLFLNGFLASHGIQDQASLKYLSIVEERIKEFLYELDDLEYSVTYVENNLIQTSKTDEYVKTIKLKENLLSKLLESYSNICQIFKSLIQDQVSVKITKFQEDHELLRKKLQANEKKCISQEAVIIDLERRLSIFQGKSNTIESYNSTLEEAKAELEKQVSFQQTQIKYLNSELSQLASIKKREDNSERLLEIIEEVKKVSNAEKTALKKALKLEKIHVKKRDESIEKLEKDILKKDEYLFNIALQRDKLKSHLTASNNEILEGKSQIEELKSQISKLKKDTSHLESNFKEEIQSKSDALKVSLQQIHDMENENFKLKRLTDSLKDDLMRSNEEIMALKSRPTNPTVYLSQNNEAGDGETALAEVRYLIKLLKDSKEYFETIQTKPRSPAKCPHNDESFTAVSKAIGEVKDHLLEIKEKFESLPKDKNEKLELVKQLKELQSLFSQVSKENEALKSEIEEMKRSRVHQPSDSYSSFRMDSKFSAKNLQMELNLKTEENWRLQQRERDLEHQLEDVKDRLQRREIENGKLFALEEELKTKKLEIAFLEKRKEEEFERTSNKIKELQEALDKKSNDYDSLVHYVQTLKSSYLNVFGSS